MWTLAGPGNPGALANGAGRSDDGRGLAGSHPPSAGRSEAESAPRRRASGNEGANSPRQADAIRPPLVTPPTLEVIRVRRIELRDRARRDTIAPPGSPSCLGPPFFSRPRYS